MALVRCRNRGSLTPWSALRDVDTYLDRFLGEVSRDHGAPERAWAPAVDLKETDDAYIVEADMPGLRKEDIELTAVDNIVTLKGERKHEEESTKDGYHRVERRHGQFQRSFEIPSGFDGSRIEAQYTDGVLKVTLPKREETKPKLIDVKVN